jgi:rod shape-determining protein MreC
LYDKTVRRRRIVLALLVVVSLALLTVYFREAPGGTLHSVQRGFITVISPIQDGANKALKPVRDLFGWFGDTLHAKGQRNKLLKQNEQLRQQALAGEAARRQLAELTRIMGLDSNLKLSSYAPVNAQVIGRSPTLWYSTVDIDKGTAAGVHVDDPVIGPDGLVGKVTTVTSNAAQVTLLTDPTSGVSAAVNATGASGHVGQAIVTSGTVSSKLDSLFPPGIPIGTVTSVDTQDVYQRIHVRPFATLRKLDYVQVLSRGARGVRPGGVSQAVASLHAPGHGNAAGAAPGNQTASTRTGP